MVRQFLFIKFSIPTWFINPFGYLLVVLLGVELFLPRLWNLFEYVWWRVALGSSSLSDELRRDAKRDFYFLIEHYVKDRGTPKPLAVLFTVGDRLIHLRAQTITLRRRKAEMCPERFQSMIDELNRLWRIGKNPKFLNDYVLEIERSAYVRSIDPELRLLGLSAISVIKYALGSIAAGHRLGRENFKNAHLLEQEFESVQKFLASYGFFFSTIFIGQCHRAIDLMGTQWNRYYAPLSDDEKRNLREQLFAKLILNPVLAYPRHMFLAFALAEIIPLERKHWPSELAFRSVNLEEPDLEVRWFDSWNSVAEEICTVEPISLSFTRAYGAFFLSLLLLDNNVQASNLHRRINEAFGKADASSAPVAQYATSGFKGLYHLICRDDEKAWEELGNAASFSEISGNRFADFVFTCSLAVAAARLNRPNRYLVPQAERHMSQARRLARTLKSDLFTRLCDAAESAICLQLGDTVKAQMFAERSGRARSKSRLLRIFDVDALEPQNRFGPTRLRLTA